MATADRENLQRLVEKATGGDRKAYSEIVRQLMKPVVALAHRMTGDREAAFDLAQDTFVTAWQKLSTFRGEAGLENWLFRIAANKTLNYLESRKRFRSDEESESLQIDSGADSPERALEEKELRGAVLQFMQTLPEQQRLVFNLRFYREMKFEEIASVLDRSVGTVKTNYREAVRKLRVFANEKGWSPT
jgi:RNA polymerase sigma-70 factor (ECF subfamily)